MGFLSIHIFNMLDQAHICISSYLKWINYFFFKFIVLTYLKGQTRACYNIHVPGFISRKLAWKLSSSDSTQCGSIPTGIPKAYPSEPHAQPELWDSLVWIWFTVWKIVTWENSFHIIWFTFRKYLLFLKHQKYNIECWA